MALKIFRRNGPLNQIQSGIPAKDGEFVYADSGLPYSGKYHIQNGVAYAGEDPSVNEVPVPLDQVPENQFASLISTIGYATAAYQMAKQNVELIKQTAEKILPNKPIQAESASLKPREGKYAFAQKTNDPDKVIKQFNLEEKSVKATLGNAVLVTLRKDPLYKIVDIDFSSPDAQQQIEEGDKTIPGLKTFVSL